MRISKHGPSQTQEPSTTSIDELDLKLVSELVFDARQSYECLAQKLGINPITIRKRMQRLVNSKAITIGLTADPRAFGLQMNVLVGIKTFTGRANVVADYLSSHPRVMVIMMITGRYDLLIAAAFREREEVFEFQDVVLSKSADLLDAELMTVVKIFKSSWMFMHGSTSASGNYVPRSLDDQDLELIKILELTPRDSISCLSKKLGMRRQSVSERLHSLIDSGVINVTSIPNPRVTSFGTTVIILIKVHLGKISAVANALVSLNRVKHLVVTTEPFEIVMWIIVKSLDELTRFLKDDLNIIPGIVSYDIMILSTLPKFSLKYVNY